MGQRLKKAALMFGQVEQQPRPTLSDFYRGVGESQAGAVQGVTKGVQETTAKLPGEFGVKYGAEGKPEFAEKAPFRPTVDTKTAVAPIVAPPAGFISSEEAAKAAEQAGKNVQQIEEERKASEAALGKSTEQALTGAGEAAKTAQERLTEGRLGERREASELEKASKDYRNVLTTTPATSNIAAVSSLMRFYDPKYATLESGLRQGEISLARQQAGQTEAALQQAEGERAGAVAGYKQAATQTYEDTKNLIEQEKQNNLKKIEEYYGGLSKKEKESGAAATSKAKELKAAEDKAAADKKALEEAETQKIGDTLFGAPDPVTGARRGGSFDAAFNQIDSGSQWQNELDEYKKAENDMFFRQHKGWTQDKQRIEAKIGLHREYRSAMLALKEALQDAIDSKNYTAVKDAQTKINSLVDEYKRKDSELPRPSKRIRIR